MYADRELSIFVRERPPILSFSFVVRIWWTHLTPVTIALAINRNLTMNHQLSRRQSESPFSPRSYYRLINDNAPKLTLSTGAGWSTVNLTTLGGFSSENWQIYHQQGRYFIRNYDSLLKSQFGLDSTSSSSPKLLKTSGVRGQQWVLTKADGGWTITNVLRGENVYLAMSSGGNYTQMQTNKQGAIWQFELNSSAGLPKDPAMLIDVENVEGSVSSTISSTITSAASTSATSTSAASMSSVTMITTTNTAPASATVSQTPSGSASSTANAAPQEQGLQAGAIAGIAVGAVALVFALAVLGFLLWRRKKEKTAQQPPQYQYSDVKPVELADTPRELPSPMEPKQTYAYRVELG
ncbi:hypothetical protein B0J11DRAFT_527094 [Dendryphion nanum]|uniref:Ricin B lectin domain-containing protein n=1 Tax=Dendryphion nanum TaxID=256645 RepID=A0A9P9DXK1_9PLEO|nr:hypothetical protein B0J11DRAFT_527094 [Dendryphion nanum]